MKKVLFIYNTTVSWTGRDFEILQKKFAVKRHKVSLRKVLELDFLTDFLRAEIVFCWFGSLTFLPFIILSKCLKKKVVVVAGGYDVAKHEELKHGTFSKSLIHVLLGRLLFKFPEKILAVSESTKREAIQNAKARSSIVETIYHGFEEYKGPQIPWKERSDSVVMIANIDEKRYFLKGMDKFLLLSKSLPSVQFKLIGKIDSETEAFIESRQIKNLELLGFIEYNSKEFNKVVSHSKIITQLSEYESFGASVVEGAVRGCFPIVTNAFALPEIVKGRVGFIAEDFESLPLKINLLLSRGVDCKKVSRQYTQAFSVEARKEKLINALISL